MKKFLAIGILIGLIGYTVYTQVWLKNSVTDLVETGQVNPFNPDEKIGTVINKGDLINNVAPDFTLETLDGQTVTLSQFKGQKVFINFWATWCPPCREEMPEIQTFSEENPDIVILAVNLRNTEKSDEAINEYITGDNYTFPVPLDRTGQIGNAYKVLTLPTSFFINTSGEVQYKFIGPLTLEKIKELTKSLD